MPAALGPFPLRIVIIAIALILAWLLARRWGNTPEPAHGKRAASVLLDGFFVGVLAARVAYVLRWWDEYMQAPWSMLAMSDGGFLLWVGLPIGLAFIAWRTRHQRVLRKPIWLAAAAGLALWLAAHGSLWWLRQSVPPLPGIVLSSTAGEPVNLRQFTGRPLVVNLWATWCPPCRREMPVLAQAQSLRPDVTFALINQGESRDEITAYLQASNLRFDNVLVDTHSATMQHAGARALPTTLFYDANGRLVHSHLGELTRATLAATLQRHFGGAPAKASAAP